MESNKNLISVIVPVFNVEAYLARCLDCILNQTYSDYEMLLIDDGSTDSSGKICDDYSRRDPRIKVFHKKNGGVSSARNIGLRNAVGGCVVFVDSDDFIHPQYLETLYNAYVSEKADIVICDYEKIKEYPEEFHPFYTEAVVHRLRYEDYLDYDLCNTNNIVTKLYRKEVLKDHLFDEDLVYGEDAVFNFSLFFCKEGLKMVKVDESLYYYFDRPGSAVNTMTKDVALAEVDWYLNHWDIFLKQYKWIVCEHAIKAALHIRMELYLTPAYKRVMGRWQYLSRGLIDRVMTVDNMPLTHRLKFFVALNFFGLYRLALILHDPSLIELEKKKRDEYEIADNCHPCL